VSRPEPTEEELRAQLEEELRRVTVDDVLIQTIVSLVNLGGRRAGVAPGTEGERDLDQVQLAIDSVQALLPLLERRGREEVRPIRDALAQLQRAYARQRSGQERAEPSSPPPSAAGGPEGPDAPGQPAPGEGPGPAQSSGRLWVPGQ
jgi:hypothetical protein